MLSIHNCSQLTRSNAVMLVGSKPTLTATFHVAFRRYKVSLGQGKASTKILGEVYSP